MEKIWETAQSNNEANYYMIFFGAGDLKQLLVAQFLASC
jgi:hypothetical protein